MRLGLKILALSVLGLAILGWVVFFLEPAGETQRVPDRKAPAALDGDRQHAAPTPSPQTKPFLAASQTQPSPNVSHSVATAPSEAKMRPGLDLEVPVGAKVPSALMDAGCKDDGPEIQEILDSIINDFIAAIEHSRQAGRNSEEAWEEALRVADEKYKLFFGQDAFNEANLEAGVEALEDGTSPSTP
jgi:hypothetical protein